MPISSKSPTAQQRLEQAFLWVRTHQETFWSVVGTVGAAVVLAVFLVQRREGQTEQAWNELANLQGQAMQNPGPQTLKGIDEWIGKYGRASAGPYGKFLKGDLLTRTSDYTNAVKVYAELAQTASPQDYRPLALAAQRTAEELSGRLPEALAIAQAFSEKYPDHFLAAQNYIAQARLSEATGNPGAASALYDRFIVLFPQSPWTALAKARLQAISPKPPASIAK
jgi:tetratricopeptide (TPR) repeat protein